MKKNISSAENDGYISRVAGVLGSLREGTKRLTDISNGLNLNKATVHRLLKTLEASGFIAQDPINRQYCLGPFILALGANPTAAHHFLVTCAYEDMVYLRELTGETVAIQIRVAARRLCLEEVQSQQNLRHTMAKGTVAPLHAGSGGKVLLSELPQRELDAILKTISLSLVRPNTIVDRDELLREIDKIKRQGFATSFAEFVEGTASISVPVKNHICPVALSLFGPEIRFPKMMDCLKEIKESAVRISTKLLDFSATAKTG